MARYKCPNQIRSPRHAFIMCRAKTSDENALTDIQKALQAYCLYQSHCSCSGQAENTDESKECYAKMNHSR